MPEKVLQQVGHFPAANAIISMLVLLLTAEFIAADAHTVLFSGVLGIVTYMLVNGFGDMMTEHMPTETAGQTTYAVGRAAFSLFLYQVIDASFSFDGVIGAFAITSDPIIILLGLGVIGAMFVRSLTLYLVEKEH